MVFTSSLSSGAPSEVVISVFNTFVHCVEDAGEQPVLSRAKTLPPSKVVTEEHGSNTASETRSAKVHICEAAEVVDGGAYSSEYSIDSEDSEVEVSLHLEIPRLNTFDHFNALIMDDSSTDESGDEEPGFSVQRIPQVATFDCIEDLRQEEDMAVKEEQARDRSISDASTSGSQGPPARAATPPMPVMMVPAFFPGVSQSSPQVLPLTTPSCALLPGHGSAQTFAPLLVPNTPSMAPFMAPMASPPLASKAAPGSPPMAPSAGLAPAMAPISLPAAALGSPPLAPMAAQLAVQNLINSLPPAALQTLAAAAAAASAPAQQGEAAPAAPLDLAAATSPGAELRSASRAAPSTLSTTTSTPSTASSLSAPGAKESETQRRGNSKGKQQLTEVAARTTVMLRNLPINYTRAALLELVDTLGFSGKYDFCYFPIDFRLHSALGYAFLNMVTPDDAEALRNMMDGFSGWNFPSTKSCNVGWSSPHQGLEAHIERYRNSPLMHEDVPDEYRPVLFSNGRRIPFPAPTKRIKPPRQGTQRMLV